jgi:hypothetical protein
MTGDRGDEHDAIPISPLIPTSPFHSVGGPTWMAGTGGGHDGLLCAVYASALTVARVNSSM